jgi:hypothetical protein
MLLGWGVFGLMVYAAIFSQVVRNYGWAATLLLMSGVPFLAAAFICFVFPDTAVLAPPLTLSGGALLLGGAIRAWNYPPAQARRIEQRRFRHAEYRWAKEIIDQNQRLRRR